MYHIIVNPASKSGRGQKIWNQIVPYLKENNVKFEVLFSYGMYHVTHLVKELVSSHPDELLYLIVLGGDGTLNECLQGISDFDKVYLGYIPTGSSNDMARDLSLPKDPVHILKRILSGKVHRVIDIGCLKYGNHSEEKRNNIGEFSNTRYFAVSCGIGFDAAVCEEAMQSTLKNFLNKMKLGKLTYLAIALKQIITAKDISCDISFDGGKPIHLNKLLFLAGMIHQYEGGGFKFCPDAMDTDGIMDVCTAGNLRKLKILFILPTAFSGKHYRFKGIDGYRCKELTIKTSSPLWVHTDGEVNAKSSHITLTCLQKKLHLLV